MAQPPADPTTTSARDDIVLAFRTLKSRAQGRIVRLGPAVDTILKTHDYPDPISRVLGEALALSAMLGSLLRTNGRLILQTKTDGPLSQLAVTLANPGRMRGLATFDEAAIEDLLANARDGRIGQGLLLGEGHLAMTIDPGGRQQMTQGIVALSGHTLAQAAHTYFRQSEQIPTFVRLAVARHAVRGDDSTWHWRAGGLILQQLPEDASRAASDTEGGEDDPDDDWRRAHMLAATVEDHELLDPTLSPEQLLLRLFAEEGVRADEPLDIEAYCGCSRDRVEQMLKSFGSAELSDMREDDGGVTVTCEYCSKRYRFSPEQVDEI